MTKLLLRAGFFLIRTIPKPLWVLIIKALAFIASWLPTKELAKIKANYHHVDFDFGGLSPRQFARAVFFHQGLMFIETLRYSFDSSAVTIDGIADFGRALAVASEASQASQAGKPAEDQAQRGIIIATGHIGSWELLGAATARAQGKMFSALAKAPDNPELFKALDEYRKRLKVKSLWNRDDDLVKNMIDTLTAGDALGMVIDQKPKSRRGYKVNFLGAPAAMVGGPIKIGRKTQATILGAYCLRVKPFHYQICWEQVADQATFDSHTDKDLAQVLADSMAAAIAKAPSQWAWNYKRWSTKATSPW